MNLYLDLPRKRLSIMLFLFLSEGSFFFGERGDKSCQGGSEIMTAQECRVACEMLKKKVGIVKNGRVCYVAGNGRCRQDGRKGKNTLLVCIANGNTQIL